MHELCRRQVRRLPALRGARILTVNPSDAEPGMVGESALERNRVSQYTRRGGLTGGLTLYPLVLFAKTRRYCSSCERKTRWLFHYSEFMRVRVCAFCMTTAQRAAFVEQYGAFLRGFRVQIKTGGDRY